MDLKNEKLILASNSPRRKEILKNAGYDFIVIPSRYEENISGKFFSKNLLEDCAYNKAKDVYKRVCDKNSVIVSADTVVVIDNIILGKPKDDKEALLMLQKLSSRTHLVASAVCIMNKDILIKDSAFSYVAFRKLSDNDIKNYILCKHPFDKAGSYGIQDENFDFAIKIAGELNNIIGFPRKLFEKMYTNIMR